MAGGSRRGVSGPRAAPVTSLPALWPPIARPGAQRLPPNWSFGRLRRVRQQRRQTRALGPTNAGRKGRTLLATKARGSMSYFPEAPLGQNGVCPRPSKERSAQALSHDIWPMRRLNGMTHGMAGKGTCGEIEREPRLQLKSSWRKLVCSPWRW